MGSAVNIDWTDTVVRYSLASSRLLVAFSADTLDRYDAGVAAVAPRVPVDSR